MHSSFCIALIFCAAWVAISKHGIIGPFWFENANQEPVTVRKERYIEVLNKLWGALGLLNRGRGWNRVQRDIQWFQQDGAPPHTANITLDWLDHKFPNRLISRKREPEWSPHSPDLNPPDFYLWGFLKDNVYRHKRRSTLYQRRSASELSITLLAESKSAFSRTVDIWSIFYK